MPLKPQKSSFSLTTINEEERSFATISLTTNSQTSNLSDEDKETSDNTEASRKFQILTRQGLNPLKPVIIANTEFVPVGEGNKPPDSEGLKIQFGENNVLSVNAVTKLFELHRQIRMATARSANRILSNAKGYNVDTMMDQLTKSVETYLAISAKSTIDETVTEIIKNMISATSPTKIKASKKKATKASKKALTGKISFSKDDQLSWLRYKPGGRLSAGLKQTLSNNKDDPFFRTLVEYAIFEVILQDIIRYLSGILAIKDSAEKRWSIYEVAVDKKLGKMNTTSFTPTVMKYFDHALNQNARTAGWVEAEGVLEDLLKFGPSRGSSDVTCLLQTFISAADTLHLYDGYHESLNNNFVVKSKPKMKARGTSVRDGLKKLRKMSLVGMYSHRSLNGIDFQMLNEAHDEAVKDILEDTGATFTESALDEVHDQFPSDMEDSDVYAELLAAILFNDVTDAARFGVPARSKLSAFDVLGNSSVANVQDVNDYYEALIASDLNYRRTFTKKDFDYNLFDNTQPGALLTFLKSKKSQSSDSDLDEYIAMESTDSTPNNAANSYLTGPEFFIDLALQRGDESFRELRKFVTQYRNFSLKYVENVDAMTRMFEVDDAFRELCGYVADDISQNQIQMGAGMPVVFKLALISTYAEERKDLIRLYQSAYFGALVNRAEGKDGDGVGIPDVPGDPFVSLKNYEYEIRDASGEPTGMFEFGKVTQDQARRRILRMANQIIMRLFMDHKAELKYSNILVNASEAVRHLSGEMHAKSFYATKYTDEDKKFDKIDGTNVINSGTGIALDDQPQKSVYIIKRKSGEKFGTPIGGINKEFTYLETGVTFSPGMNNALKKFITNKHLEDVGILDESTRIAFNMSLKDTALNHSRDALEFSPLTKRNIQGAAIGLSEHQRGFIFFAFLATTFARSMRLLINSQNPSGAENATIKLHMSSNEMNGIYYAFRDVADQTRTSPYTQEMDDPPPSAGMDHTGAYANNAGYRAYKRTREELEKVRNAIRKRQNFICMNVLAPVIHSQMLYTQYEKIREYVRNGDGTEKSKLGISAIKDKKVGAYRKTLDLLTEEGVSEMYKSRINTMLGSRYGYTNEDIPSKKQLKLMIKILTNSGYGLLESEKRGPKTICHVGITNSMLNSLRYEAYKDTGDKSFLDAGRFCINIFKRNEIDSQEMVYPKTFMFSSRQQIIDYDHSGEPLNHIKNYSDTWSFNDIVKNVEFTKWHNKQATEPEGDPFDTLETNYQAILRTGSNLVGVATPKDLIINHLYDYAFKLYYKFALGIDFNESTFPLVQSDIEAGVVTGGIGSASDEIQNDYDTLINQLTQLYPAANIDQKLASELFRATKIIAANPVYSLRSKVKRVLYPKKFDRVFSILVNEKDFILYTPVYDKEFEDIYKTTPNFSYTSRIARPTFNSSIKGESHNKNKYLSPLVDSKTSSARKHKRGCEEDFPEIFSMYATITMLPKGSM
mgnify:CR=1 FL=1